MTEEIVHAVIPVSDEELEQWALNRADDAGRLARELLPIRRAHPAPPGMYIHGVSLEVATALVACFGGDETDMTVMFIKDGHSGPGFYAWRTDYPEDGSVYLGAPSEHSSLPGAQRPSREEPV